jgi:hypothetical protein
MRIAQDYYLLYPQDYYPMLNKIPTRYQNVEQILVIRIMNSWNSLGQVGFGIVMMPKVEQDNSDIRVPGLVEW